MIYFFDSSAFAKAFIEEPGSDAVGRLLASLEPGDKAVSSLARLEVRSAIRRYQRAGSFSSEVAEAAILLLSDELTRMEERPLTGDVFGVADSMVDRHGLRTLDALQLAAAVAARRGVHVRVVTFVASDAALLRAATGEGFTVWNPNVPIAESDAE